MIKNLFINILFLFIAAQCYGQEQSPRQQSMASCNLVLSDRNNDINSYDFANNPAGLVEDQESAWMSVKSWLEYADGHFRRPLDPAKRWQYNLQAEGVKPIDSTAVFRGFIRYYMEDLIEVNRGLEYEPYHDIFSPIDTTTGTFDYYGPLLGIEYGKKIQPWLSIGARIAYRLQDGLKREPTKMKVDGRMIFGTIGATIRPHQKVDIGFAYRPFSVQYRLNANKSFLLDYPIIYKFFGDSLLVKNDNVSTYNRRTLDNGHGADVAIIYNSLSWLTAAVKGGWMLENREIDEGGSEGKRDIDDYGSWQKKGPWAETLLKSRLNETPWAAGFSVQWSSFDTWARTPRFETLFEEMNSERLNYGVGLSYDDPASTLSLGMEYHTTEFAEEKHNYYQQYDWSRDNTTHQLRFGGEIRFSPTIALRCGGVTGEEVAEYHLSLLPVNIKSYSLGLGLKFNRVHLDITAVYYKTDSDYIGGNRERLFMVMEISQW